MWDSIAHREALRYEDHLRVDGESKCTNHRSAKINRQLFTKLQMFKKNISGQFFKKLKLTKSYNKKMHQKIGGKIQFGSKFILYQKSIYNDNPLLAMKLVFYL